jgi:hypothetical protein
MGIILNFLGLKISLMHAAVLECSKPYHRLAAFCAPLVRCLDFTGYPHHLSPNSSSFHPRRMAPSVAPASEGSESGIIEDVSIDTLLNWVVRSCPDISCVNVSTTGASEVVRMCIKFQIFENLVDCEIQLVKYIRGENILINNNRILTNLLSIAMSRPC